MSNICCHDLPRLVLQAFALLLLHWSVLIASYRSPVTLSARPALLGTGNVRHPCDDVRLKLCSVNPLVEGDLPSKDRLSDEVDFVSSELFSSDVSYIRIVPWSRFESTEPDRTPLDLTNFSTIFRHSAPYIAMHRGSVMVIHLPSCTLSDNQAFEGVMDDIAILHLLGIKLVLVVGVRGRLDKRLLDAGIAPSYSHGMRVTDQFALQLLKEESGKARFEIESALARGFRGMTDRSGIDVVSGNFFYGAKPLGVRGGVDFKLTGEVRRIEEDNIRRRLDGNDVVLLTSVGCSTSGEVFSVPSESLAAECAAKLKAAKLIFITSGEMLVDSRRNDLAQVQSLRLNQACALLDQWGIYPGQYNYMEHDNQALNASSCSSLDSFSSNSSRSASLSSITDDNRFDIASINGSLCDAERDSIASFILLLARCVHAVTGGVRRAHLIGPIHGALLKELFTRDGSGTLISRDMYEGVRPAKESDLRSILDIIRPLEEEGILVHRTSEEILRDISNVFLLTRDGSTLACGMLKRYSNTHAEVACLAVHPQYRRNGRGETLLAYLERRALIMGVTHIFLLSTRTMQWFEERGFKLSDPTVLPPNRAYNTQRGSKVYIKQLGTQRDVEVEELLWGIA